MFDDDVTPTVQICIDLECFVIYAFTAWFEVITSIVPFQRLKPWLGTVSLRAQWFMVIASTCLNFSKTRLHHADRSSCGLGICRRLRGAPGNAFRLSWAR
ncbi:hypothetical protein [Thiomonas sp.]|uniref:Uncharacterized protein n=1 Tax=mine drainage metagenome TaxID=410659 RepID=E6PKN9_9ZZZZ